MTTQKQLRAYFWECNPSFGPLRRAKKKQNDYPADVRMAFVDFVYHLQRDEIISQKLAEKATL